MGWGRRVVDRFRTDGAPRVAVLVVVVAGLMAWDRSNDVDLRDDLARQVRDSEAVGRFVVPLTPAQADGFASSQGPTNRRAAALYASGNDDLAPLFRAAYEAEWEDDLVREVTQRHASCRYWPVQGVSDVEELLQLCWDGDRPGVRPSSFVRASVVID